MESENLVKMANRIGDFFEAMPEADEARAGIANHLQKFWEPRMRRALFAYIERSGGHDLHPMVLEAVLQHRAELQPARAA
jgi:formate dehydrogenase subunit delta